MATEIIMNVYGLNLSAEELKERSTWHERTWIECEIPVEIESEINAFIDWKLKQFEKKCGCGLCKLNAK